MASEEVGAAAADLTTTPDVAAGSVVLMPVLVGLLFFSGAAALIYQVLWLRLLSLTFGVTTYAASVVLASFMGGLAVGSVIAGRLADRAARPLRMFGIVELLIGCVGVLTPWLLALVHRAYVVVFSRLPDSLIIGTTIRFTMSSAVLIVPTALMGATLPIVVKACVSRWEGLGTRVSLLYAGNTAGAILGTLIAGFYLIPHVGLSRSFLLAASLNAVVGLSAVAVGARRATTSRSAVSDVPRSAIPPRAWMVLGVFAISGFASLALEVVWFRVLGILLGPTSYAFTVMLAIVLAGIAIGSAVASPFMRLRLDWLQVLAVIQMLVGLAAAASLSGLGRTPDLPVTLHPLVARTGLDFLVPTIVASAVAIFPTAFLLGAAFPIGLRLWADTGEERRGGERVGVFYAVNTAGAILGSLAAGFVLLPSFGSRSSLLLLAALFLSSGFAVQALVARTRPVLTVLLLLFVVAFVSISRDVPDPQEIARRRGLFSAPTIWQEEGVQTTVVVTGDLDQQGGRVLYLNGRHQADDKGSMLFVHRRIGLLPALLASNPRKALVVGLGGGATAGALSQFPGIVVDIIELSPGVVRGAAFFDYVNFDVLRRPNVHLRIDDGRDFLLRTRNRYDVITADAILPHHAGSNNLNSVEYFRLVRGRLAPNGVALHWNGGTTEAEHKTILSAFVEVFPHATLWADGTLMAASDGPLTLSHERVEALLANPETRALLELLRIETFDDFERSFRAGPDDIRAYLGDSPALSDDRPTLEYFAALPQHERDLSKIGRTVDRFIVP